MSESAFETVVIGSGLGGLTAAALVAKSGRKVCVIERNHSVGGAASTFKTGALTIEPALHQTADPHDPTEPKHAILTELGLLDEIEWIPVDPFFSVKGGPVGDIFDLPVGFDAAQEALSRRFPRSRDGFARLLGAMEQIHSGVAGLMKAGEERSFGKLMRAGFQLRGLVHHWRASAADILQRFLGHDEAAKFAVAGNLGYYADDPRHMAWPFFAMAQGGFLKAGGSVLLGRDVAGIDFDGGGRPAHVRHVDSRTREGEQLVAVKQVLANCAPHVLAHMLPTAERALLERAYTGRALSTSLFTAHFGLNVSPQKLGLDRYGLIALPEWMTSLNQTPGRSTASRPCRSSAGFGQAFRARPGRRSPAFTLLRPSRSRAASPAP
jgi:phytoene dehydrogenase-like protein